MNCSQTSCATFTSLARLLAFIGALWLHPSYFPTNADLANHQCRRLSEVARIKSAKDASAKAAREAGAGAAAEASSPPGLSLAQLEPLLDRWSFSRIVQVAGEALDRK